MTDTRALSQREEKLLKEIDTSSAVKAALKKVWNQQEKPAELTWLTKNVAYIISPTLVAMLIISLVSNSPYVGKLGALAAFLVWVIMILTWVVVWIGHYAPSFGDKQKLLSFKGVEEWHSRSIDARTFGKVMFFCIFIVLAYAGFYITAFLFLTSWIIGYSLRCKLIAEVQEVINEMGSPDPK